MQSLYILIPVAIVLVFIAVGVFILAVRSEQFEDLERQGMSILLDDEEGSLHQKTQSHEKSLPSRANTQGSTKK